MILTYADLQDRVMRMLDETETNSPTTIALVKDFLTAAHQQRCVEYPWSWMVWPAVETITTVADQQDYALHEQFHRPWWFRVNDNELLEDVPFREAGTGEQPELTASDNIRKFTWGPIWPVMKQPNGTVISVVSSTSGDAQTVTIRGEDENGYQVSETITATGATTASGTQTFSRVLDVTLSAAAAGNFSLYSSSTLILRLTPGQVAKQFRTIRLIDPPTAGVEIDYQFFRIPLVLTNDNDIPLLPAAHSMLLVWDALVTMSGYLTETNAQTLGIWRQKQQEAELALYQAYANESQTLGSRPQYVRYMDDALFSADPRNFR